jgi:hypothetical protein
VDTILGILPGKNYLDTRALADIVSVCLHRCQQWCIIEVWGKKENTKRHAYRIGGGHTCCKNGPPNEEVRSVCHEKEAMKGTV